MLTKLEVIGSFRTAALKALSPQAPAPGLLAKGTCPFATAA